MKQLLVILLLIMGTHAQAQFTLEHTYDSAATYNFCPGPGSSQLMYLKLEASGERYVKINRCGKLISLYDMDHSLVKNISLDMVYTASPYFTIGYIMYISEHLFNLDDKLEFMYVVDSGTYKITQVYNETGELLFSESGSPDVILTMHAQQYPIYNTDNGTKLMLSYETGEAKVFGLGGMLGTEIDVANTQLVSTYSALSNPYPNPAQHATTIDYTIPEGNTTGEIILFRITGEEIARYPVTNAYSSIQIPTNNLIPGNYFYTLQTTSAITETKHLIIIQ